MTKEELIELLNTLNFEEVRCMTLSYYKKKKTLLHELAHIELNQLGQSDKLLAFKRDQYEDEADKYIELLLSYINDSKI